MEAGGFTTRELLSILDGLKNKVNVIGGDVVEVSPPYDTIVKSPVWQPPVLSIHY